MKKKTSCAPSLRPVPKNSCPTRRLLFLEEHSYLMVTTPRSVSGSPTDNPAHVRGGSREFLSPCLNGDVHLKCLVFTKLKHRIHRPFPITVILVRPHLPFERHLGNGRLSLRHSFFSAVSTRQGHPNLSSSNPTCALRNIFTGSLFFRWVRPIRFTAPGSERRFRDLRPPNAKNMNGSKYVLPS